MEDGRCRYVQPSRCKEAGNIPAWDPSSGENIFDRAFGAVCSCLQHQELRKGFCAVMEENNLQAQAGSGNKQDNSKGKIVHNDQRRWTFHFGGLSQFALLTLLALVAMAIQPWQARSLPPAGGLDKVEKVPGAENAKMLPVEDPNVKAKNEEKSVTPLPEKPPAPSVDELIQHYLNIPAITDKPIKVGLVLDTEMTSDLRDQVISQSFDVLSDRCSIASNPIKAKPLREDGCFENMWNCEFDRLNRIPLSHYFDYLILVKTTDSTHPIPEFPDHVYVQCEISLKILSTAPALSFFRPADISIVGSGGSRFAALGPLREQLQEKLTQVVAPLLSPPQK